MSGFFAQEIQYIKIFASGYPSLNGYFFEATMLMLNKNEQSWYGIFPCQRGKWKILNALQQHL